MSQTYQLGVATAYGAAVRGGYVGTYEDWCEAMADLGRGYGAMFTATYGSTTAQEIYEANEAGKLCVLDISAHTSGLGKAYLSSATREAITPSGPAYEAVFYSIDNSHGIEYYTVVGSRWSTRLVVLAPNTSPELNGSPTAPSASTGTRGAIATAGDVQNAVAGYVHTQSQAAAEWTITHNLGRYPSVTVVDSAGSVCIGDVQYVDEDTITISFQAAFAGAAYLN